MTEEPSKRKPKKPPVIMRCSKCRLLCLTGSRSKKAYLHGAWNSKLAKVDHCPGSKQVTLDPKATRRSV
jgi:hypothetical protein